MDLVSLIITLVLLAVVAAAAYFAYQKIVVEGGIFETTPTEPIVSDSTPSFALSTPGEVAGGVPGVDNMKGRPGSASIGTADRGRTANKIHYYGGGEKLVPDGDAKTASVCHDYSKSLGINNWGWDRKKKSCFAYVDSGILTAMGETEANKVEGKSDYIVGCTEAGVQVLDGCRDFTKGTLVRGYKSGGAGTVEAPGSKFISFDACRAYANENGYEGFSIRTNRHKHSTNSGTCFVYKDAESDLTGFVGANDDMNHVTACTDPSKKIIDGCQ